MNARQLDTEASLLYHERVYERGPEWSMLGDVTKSVWREYVLAGQLARLW